MLGYEGSESESLGWGRVDTTHNLLANAGGSVHSSKRPSFGRSPPRTAGSLRSLTSAGSRKSKPKEQILIHGEKFESSAAGKKGGKEHNVNSKITTRSSLSKTPSRRPRGKHLQTPTQSRLSTGGEPLIRSELGPWTPIASRPGTRGQPQAQATSTGGIGESSSSGNQSGGQGPSNGTEKLGHQLPAGLKLAGFQQGNHHKSKRIGNHGNSLGSEKKTKRTKAHSISYFNSPNNLNKSGVGSVKREIRSMTYRGDSRGPGSRSLTSSHPSHPSSRNLLQRDVTLTTRPHTEHSPNQYPRNSSNNFNNSDVKRQLVWQENHPNDPHRYEKNESHGAEAAVIDTAAGLETTTHLSQDQDRETDSHGHNSINDYFPEHFAHSSNNPLSLAAKTLKQQQKHQNLN